MASLFKHHTFSISCIQIGVVNNTAYPRHFHHYNATYLDDHFGKLHYIIQSIDCNHNNFYT